MKTFQTETSNRNRNEVWICLCYYFYGRILEENVIKFWKETSDFVEVYRWNIFHFRAWCISFHSTIIIYRWILKRENNIFTPKYRTNSGELKTDLLIKATDTHQFLDRISCHPYHCKKGIPLSQNLRLNIICSDNETFERHGNDWKKLPYGKRLQRKNHEKADIKCPGTF